jgi:D-alanine-D-alanine ligase
MSYKELLDRMISLAVKRHRQNKAVTHSFKTNVLAGVRFGSGTKSAKGAKG